MSGGNTRSRVTGQVAAVDGQGVVHVESVYDTEIDDLWDAVTDPARLARWIGDVTGDLRADGTFHVRFTSGWAGPGRVDVCDPPRGVRVTTGEGDEQTIIEATLAPHADGTQLVVTESGLPVGEVHLHGAGWQAHLEDLGRHLGGEPMRDWRGRWSELIPDYPPLG